MSQDYPNQPRYPQQPPPPYGNNPQQTHYPPQPQQKTRRSIRRRLNHIWRSGRAGKCGIIAVAFILLLSVCTCSGSMMLGTNNTGATPQKAVAATAVPTDTPTIAVPTDTPVPTPKPEQLASLPESLTFHGDISGKLTMGTDSHPITHNNPTPDLVQKSDGTFFEPAPPWTQCSDFDTMAGRDYVAVIVGNVNGMRYAVTIEINENNSAYTKPGTELRPGNINSGGSVNVYEMSGKNRRWQQVYGPAQQDTVIVLYPDRIAGTVNAWMATTDQSQKTADSTLHMQGNWRCG